MLARLEWTALACVLVALLALQLGYSSFRHGVGNTLRGCDSQYYYATLRSAVIDHDLDFKNELTSLTPHAEDIGQISYSPQTGRALNKYPIGWAIIALVPYAIVHAIVLLFAGAGLAGPASGYEVPYQLAASLAHVTAAWGGMLFTYLLLRRYVPPRPSWLALTLLLVGSPLLVYSAQDVHMPHAGGYLAVSLFTYCVVRLAEDERPARLRWLTLGLAGSLMIVTRYSSVVFVPLVGYVAWNQRGDPSRRAAFWRGSGLAVLGALPLSVCQLIYNDRLFGSPWAYSYGSEGFTWLQPQFVDGIFSHRNGLVFFSPLSAIAFIGLVGALLGRWSAAPRPFLLLAIVSLTSLAYLNSSWWCWWFGHTFGARAYIEASGLLCLGLALLLSARTRAVRACTLLAAIPAAAWTLGLLYLRVTRELAPDGSTTIQEILTALRGHL